MARLFGAGVVTAVTLAAAAACSSFSGKDDEGAPAVAAPDGGGGPGIDGGPPPDGATPADAPPVVLVTGQSQVVAIAATDSHVYWVERGPGRVHRMTASGDDLVDLDTSAGSPSAIAVALPYVAWADFGKRLLRVRDEGSGDGAFRELIVPAEQHPRAIALEGTDLYVVTNEITDAGFTGKGVVFRHSLVDAGASAFLGAFDNPYDVTVFAGTPFWVASSSATIYRWQAGELAALPGELSAELIASNDQAVYWTRPPDNVIRAYSDGVTRTLVTDPTPRSLVADGSGVYWIDAAGRVRRRAPSPPNPVTTLLSVSPITPERGHAKLIALSSQWVFVVDYPDDGPTSRILRIAKQP